MITSIAIKWPKKRSEHCSKMREIGWKFLVTSCDEDLLYDRQVEFVDTLKGKWGGGGRMSSRREVVT